MNQSQLENTNPWGKKLFPAANDAEAKMFLFYLISLF